MKYVLLFIPWMLLIILSLFLGCIMYLWKFSEEDFRKGASFIQSKIGFLEWMPFV